MLKTAGLILLVLIAYFAWRFIVVGEGVVLVTNDTGKRVSAEVKHHVPGKQLVIVINNNNRENYITEISMNRSVALQLGLSQPAGFTVEELPLTGDEKKDKEMVEFAEKFNRDNLRWVGSFALAPDTSTEFIIPATITAPLDGIIDFRYESRTGPGGSISSFRVNLAGQQ